MRLSLTQRLLLVNGVVLTLFFGLAGWSVDRAAQERARSALKARLEAQVYALLGAAEEDSQGLPVMPESLPDPLLAQPDSGLYARVQDSNESYTWQSESSIGRELPKLSADVAGKPYFYEVDNQLVAVMGFDWEALDGQTRNYQVSVAYDLRLQQVEDAGFRKVLWWWLGGAATMLLIAQLLLLRWGMLPLRSLAGDVKKLETGERDNLNREVPVELAGLRDNLNSLVRHNREMLERHRNRLADLAHSLKTPLSVLTSSVEEADAEQLFQHAQQQLPRITELVNYHLKRASVSGGALLGKPLDARKELLAIVGALKKVYHARNLEVQVELDEHIPMRIEKGDFYELAGNLLENAFKYCRSRVLIRAGIGQAGFHLSVEDDGRGIPESEFARLGRRGERADQQSPGQGIGLSIVNEIIRAYQGELHLYHSELGGAGFAVTLNGIQA